MKKILIFLVIAISGILVACNKDDDGNNNNVDVPEGYTLVWADEFDGSVLNTSNWQYETGDGTEYGLPAGWGNNEKQIYTSNSDNSGLVNTDGITSLAITALKDNSGGYTSARLTTRDLGNYTYLKFSLNKPVNLVNAEIKLESPTTNAIVFLEDYTGLPVAEGFVEYTIPLADFTGLDLTQITIPFAIWNPKGAYQNFIAATVLIDNVYFSD